MFRISVPFRDLFFDNSRILSASRLYSFFWQRSRIRTAWNTFLLAIVLFAGVFPSFASASPWPIKDFEVVNVEPAGLVDENWLLGAFSHVVQTARLAGFDPDLPGYFETVEMPPGLKEEIEALFRRSAKAMEQMGFPPPRLEPQVTLANGNQAFRIYLVNKLDGSAGSYHGGPCRGPFRQEFVIMLNADQIINSGVLTVRGVQTIAHELFHAVQANTNFISNCEEGQVGNWIVEGGARAIGWYLASQFRPESYFNQLNSHAGRLEPWGHRNYSAQLPVGGYLNTRAYRTNSFWQFLAEFHASPKNEVDSPGINRKDFSYMEALLSSGGVLRDCEEPSSPCTQEIRWLDEQSRRIFKAPFRDMYARFIQAYALYGRDRRQRKAILDSEWLKGSFDRDCEEIELGDTTEDFTYEDIVIFFDANAAQCWRISFDGFPDEELPVVVKAYPAEPRSQPQLAQLTGLVADGSLRRERADVDEVDETAGNVPSANWSFVFPNNKKTLFLITNSADNAWQTTVMKDLNVRFTALKQYARMGSGPGGNSNPAAADIDSALPIKLDRFNGYVYPYSYEKVGGEYIGAGDAVEGLLEPCIVRFFLKNTNTGDSVSFHANFSGPLTPGKYQFANFLKTDPEDVVGNFLGGFVIGEGNPLAGGNRIEYGITSGEIEIKSVAGNMIRGSLSANGELGPGEDIPAFSNLSVAANFSILAKRSAGRRYSKRPYACLARRK